MNDKVQLDQGRHEIGDSKYGIKYRNQFFLKQKPSQNHCRQMWEKYGGDQLVKPIAKCLELNIVTHSSFHVLLNEIVRTKHFFQFFTKNYRLPDKGKLHEDFSTKLRV